MRRCKGGVGSAARGGLASLGMRYLGLGRCTVSVEPLTGSAGAGFAGAAGSAGATGVAGSGENLASWSSRLFSGPAVSLLT